MMGPNTVFASCIGAITVYAASNSWLQLDYLKTGPTAVMAVVTTSGAGTHTYSIEYSLDAPSSLTTWYSTGSSNLSTNAFINYTFPIRALRINLTTGTSNTLIAATVIQSAA